MGRFFLIAVLAVFLVGVLQTPAMATDIDVGAATVMRALDDQVDNWMNVALGHARTYFRALAVMYLIVVVGRPLLEGADSGPLFSVLLFEFLRVGFFWTLVSEGGTLIPGLVGSLKALGAQMSGKDIGTVLNDVPSNGVDLMWASLQNLKAFDATSFVAVGAASVATFLLVWTWGVFILSEFHAQLTIGAGIIMLGFFGSPWTARFGWSYVNYVVTAGLHLMALQLVGGLFESQLTSWIALIAEPTFITNLGAVVGITIGLFFFCIAATTLPLLVARIGGGPLVQTGASLVSGALSKGASLAVGAAAGYGLGGALAGTRGGGGGGGGSAGGGGGAAGGGGAMSALERAAQVAGTDNYVQSSGGTPAGPAPRGEGKPAVSRAEKSSPTPQGPMGGQGQVQAPSAASGGDAADDAPTCKIEKRQEAAGSRAESNPPDQKNNNGKRV